MPAESPEIHGVVAALVVVVSAGAILTVTAFAVFVCYISNAHDNPIDDLFKKRTAKQEPEQQPKPTGDNEWLQC